MALSPIGNFKTGRKSAIGTTAVQIQSTSIKTAFGVLVVADDANTAPVFVGPKGVNAGATDLESGVKLAPGSGLTLEIDNVNKVWVISTTTGQKIWYVII